MRVLFVTPELPPWVQSGGLGDVTASLPPVLRAAGVDIRVLAPAYPAALAALPHARHVGDVPAAFGAFPACRILDAGEVHGVPLLLVDCPAYYGRRGTAYQDESFADWPDNHLRFGLLCRVAALLGSGASPLSWSAQILHLNDWPSGLAAAYLELLPRPRAASLMVIHNVSHQGVFPRETLQPLGFPAAMFHIDGVEYYGRLSFLKAGLYYATRLVAVSPTYAREIETDAGGHGLGGLLRGRHRELSGILNGIDVATWNPATDPNIAATYDASRLERKAANRAALLAAMHLPDEREVMVLGIVSRLAHQKGIDWVADIAPQLATLPAQLVVLGSGDKALEGRLRALAQASPRSIAAKIGFDERLAHLVEAGADAFLMPSRFEPCGLNQMYSLRYGTPPIVRATGGLADTVVDCTEASLAAGTANGFSFTDASSQGLLATVRRAHEAWRDPVRWRRLQRNGMAGDFGWAASAQRYRAVYTEVLAARSS